MLKTLNPFNSLFGRIFLGFWGTVIFIVGIVLLVNQQLATWDKVRPADKYQLKSLYKVSDMLTEAPHYTIEKLAKKLENKFKNTMIVLKDADTGKMVYPPKIHPRLNKGIISNLALKAEPLQVRSEHITVIGPKLFDRGDKSYQLMLISKNRHSDHFWAQLWKMPIWLKLILLALVTLVPCWLIARNISKPVTKLRYSSQTLASGDLQHRVEGFDKRQDEIGHLANDFNNMADKLSSLISLYKRLLADVSHELRTPLTRLELSLAMALKEPENNQRQLARAERELHKLDDIIGNVLRLAKLENHEVSIEQKEVDLTDLLSQIIRSCQLEARAKHIDIHSEISDDLTLIGDEILLSFAFDNVIRNAIKYSPEKSCVSISSTQDNAYIRVIIQDQGTGVDEHELEQLFVPFFRGKQAMQESNGAGLGLAIASKAIMRHGGTIYAENITSQDAGSAGELLGLSVTIKLPIHVTA
ncbi:sensor histidine kinase [Kangiella marina]|uniref:histidine kinase n=1 Tax=Kangiella marina TaxID=1079178 RepID=A0ABP8ICQ4_9GAMM